MKIDITARNITLSDQLKDFIKTKLSRLTKFDKNIKLIKIILLKESRAEKVELIVSSNQNKYIANCYSSVFEKTIISAISNIQRQISKKKNKPSRNNKKDIFREEK